MSKNYQAETLECSVNAYLVKMNGRLILVDVGPSDVYGSDLGHLTASLKNAGYKPEQIDAILLTHIHMDHIGGLTNGNDLTFPSADVYISKKEADYYLNRMNKKKATQSMKNFFDGARLKLSPIIKAGKLKTLEFGSEVYPGITSIASPGHTRGHSFYALESKGQKIIFSGDIIISDVLQFAETSITSVYDDNVNMAIITRKKALVRCSSKRENMMRIILVEPGSTLTRYLFGRAINNSFTIVILV